MPSRGVHPIMTASDHRRDRLKISCIDGGNGMDPALAARWDLERRLRRRRSIMQVARIGLDLAKYVFAVHGVDARGKVAKDAAAGFRVVLFRQSAAVPGGHGGFERGALLGARAH